MSTNLYVSSVKLSQTARQYFAALAQTPWAMLLDSGNSNHVDSRYDIIVSEPVATVTTRDSLSTITYTGTGTVKHSNDDPLSLVEALLAEVIGHDSPCELPFSGGALGYFSYDLGRQFEQLAPLATRDIDLPEMAIGIYCHALIFDRLNNSISLVSRTNAHSHQEKLTQIQQPVNLKQQGVFKLTTPWRHQINKSQYQTNFDKIQQYLKSGDCYQINYTQRFDSDYQGDEYEAYLALCQHNEMPFSGYLKLEQGAILSISPERFIRCADGNIEAKPIKGTRPRGANEQADQQLIEQLRCSEKDQAENLMIVDLLRNDIGKCAKPGSVRVPDLFNIESFPGVHHLVSTVQAQLADDRTVIDLLRGAFPGGSITGAPKIRAMNIIDELEPHRRAIYCGSIGYISADNKMDSNITIRTLLCLNNIMYCWAGGGIVADSDVNDEYQECFDKVAKILPVLANLNTR